MISVSLINLTEKINLAGLIRYANFALFLFPQRLRNIKSIKFRWFVVLDFFKELTDYSCNGFNQEKINENKFLGNSNEIIIPQLLQKGYLSKFSQVLCLLGERAQQDNFRCIFNGWYWYTFKNWYNYLPSFHQVVI